MYVVLYCVSPAGASCAVCPMRSGVVGADGALTDSVRLALHLFNSSSLRAPPPGETLATALAADAAAAHDPSDDAASDANSNPSNTTSFTTTTTVNQATAHAALLAHEAACAALAAVARCGVDGARALADARLPEALAHGYVIRCVYGNPTTTTTTMCVPQDVQTRRQTR